VLFRREEDRKCLKWTRESLAGQAETSSFGFSFVIQPVELFFLL